MTITDVRVRKVDKEGKLKAVVSVTTYSYIQTRLHCLSFYHCVQGRAITCY